MGARRSCVRVGSFAWSVRERREADLFLADLLGYAPRLGYGEEDPPPPQVCGFFRPDNTTRTIAQIRAAIVARCNAEWAAWHTTTNAPKPECDATVFGRLIGYYLAANPNILPDSLTAIQNTALTTPASTYSALLTAAAATSALVTPIRTTLKTGAPGTTGNGIVDDAIEHAKQGHDSVGSFRAWSAAFVSACVRGGAISEGIEAVTTPGRTHVGRNRPLRVSLSHATYVIRAREDKAARRRGRYHAFDPSTRAPDLADIIVQDRRDNIRPGQVRHLATLPSGAETHGDIVVEVTASSVVTIGGNVADGVRKRRYVRDATTGFLVTTAPQLYSQEDDTGNPPAAPGTSCQALADKSTKRIFALLSLVEECRAAPSGGGSGPGSG
jgi:hypothetical protein